MKKKKNIYSNERWLSISHTSADHWRLPIKTPQGDVLMFVCFCLLFVCIVCHRLIVYFIELFFLCESICSSTCLWAPWPTHQRTYSLKTMNRITWTANPPLSVWTSKEKDCRPVWTFGPNNHRQDSLALIQALKNDSEPALLD